MELIEILNEDGSGTGILRKRSDVHRTGELHGSSHVWITRGLEAGDWFSVLLQRRSPDKDAFPNCLDTSCAGHVAAGDDFYCTALRELEEELGIKTEENELRFMFDHRVKWESEFHGEKFINNEINRVYMLNNPKVDLTKFQVEEISGLCWQDAKEVLAALRAGDPLYCIELPLFERFVGEALSMRRYTIHIGDYWSAPGAGSYAGSDEWTYHETYPFYGTKEGAEARAKEYIEEFRKDNSPYLASVTYWLT